ncbi:MAG: hypothetical protein ACSLFH_13825 [Desulfuromonadales bacterium]
MKNLSVQNMNFPALRRQLRRWLIAGTALLAVSAVFGCVVPGPSEPVRIKATAPEVSYKFNTDQELIEANQRAREYCSQYASTSTLEGTIIKNSDGSKTVHFECVLKTVSAPATPAPNYDYRTDNDLLRAMQAADVYCAQSGQMASYSVSTNASGTQTLEYRCVPR